MTDKEREVSPHVIQKEPQAAGYLRPKKIDDFVGQANVCQKLQLFVDAAKIRYEALDHVLLSGPPGLGKTTLASIVAQEMGSHIHYLTGPNIDKKGDLAAILTNLEPRDVLFIDEIHRLNKSLEEVLYSAMEDFSFDIIIGQGPSAKTIRLDLPQFTLVGATTRSGLLSAPFRDRFGVQLRLDFYPVEELENIVSRSAELMELLLDTSGCNEIAKRSRGTPRIANRLLKRVRDFAQVHQHRQINRYVCDQALKLFEIDHLGLDLMDRKILNTIIHKFEAGPVGIDSLASAVGEERDTLEDTYEPFLIQQGLIQRTQRGRVATSRAFDHLGIPRPSESAINFLQQEPNP